MSQPGQAEYIYDSGWVSGTDLSASYSGSYDAYHSIYVLASGSAAPSAAKVVNDVTAGTISTLTLPTANNGSVTHMGPGISGSTVANQVSYVNTLMSLKPIVQVTRGAGASWFRILVIGR